MFACEGGCAQSQPNGDHNENEIYRIGDEITHSSSIHAKGRY